MEFEKLITTDKIEWSVLVVSLLEELTINRYELALKLGITEQAVSNWTTGYRKPSQFYRRKIIETLKNSDLNIKYFLKANLKKDKIHNPTVRISPDILDFSKYVYNQPTHLRTEILNMAERFIKKG